MRRRRDILSVVVALAGIAATYFLTREREPSSAADDARDAPTTTDEQFAARFLLDRSPGATLLRFGPNISTHEAAGYPWPNGPRPDSAVRVVYLHAGVRRDVIIALADGEAGYYCPNSNGDDWKRKAKEGDWPEHMLRKWSRPLPRREL